MSHRDRDCRTGSKTFAQDLSAAIQWLLATLDLRDVKLRKDCTWSAKALISAALLWAWSSETALTERLRQAVNVARRIWKRGVPASTSYQAFIKLLMRWTTELAACLILGLRTQMERGSPKQFHIAGFLVLAGDGSKLGLCRTNSNECRFSPAKTQRKNRKKRKRRGGRPRSRKTQAQRSREKKADSPQMALTALYHVGMRLPWDWRIGPGDSSERAHMLEMSANLPSNALITNDCGFVGYEFWSALYSQKRHFVIRVGGNIRLLKRLGTVRESEGIVYLWPNKVAKQKQPPLVLRLVVVQGARHPWYLVTSVLSPQRLSDRQVAEIYRRRWGIELFFRHFKQTFGRSKLRSHKAEHAECEAHWSLLGLWTMLLYAHHQLPKDPEEQPRFSVARVLRAFRRAMHDYKCRPETGESLRELLRVAVIDRYKRKDKRSRGYPRKKYESQAQPPQIFCATTSQRELAQQVMSQQPKKGLTA
jgi:hypothetical protein